MIFEISQTHLPVKLAMEKLIQRNFLSTFKVWLETPGLGFFGKLSIGSVFALIEWLILQSFLCIQLGFVQSLMVIRILFEL